MRSKTKKEATITIGIEIIIGLSETKSPMAIAAKETWASPSPIRDIFFRTRNTPNNEHEIAIKIPVIRAFIIKSCLKIS